jgi:hypothetical protein
MEGRGGEEGNVVYLVECPGEGKLSSSSVAASSAIPEGREEEIE